MKPADVRIAGIILAAGKSARMGTPKPLLRCADGTTLLSQQCGLLQQGAIHPVLVVTGAASQEIRSLHPDLAVTWLLNEAWEKGQFSSLIVGLKALESQDVRGALVLPVDCAGIHASVFSAIIETALRNPHLDAIVPEFDGRGGHPVYLSRTLCTALAARDPLDPGSRLDRLLDQAQTLIRLPVNDIHVTMNINTPEEWESFSNSSFSAASQGSIS